MVMLGYVRITPRFPAAAQIERLRVAGVHERHMWVEGRDAESWGEMIKTIRKGDTIVVDGLHRLGMNRETIHQALIDAKLHGASIFDAANDAHADPAMLASVVEAFRVLAGEYRIPTHAEAVRRGKLGGKPGYEHLRTKENKRVWLNAKSNAEAARKLGVPLRTLYRWWGKSGRLPGWPQN